MQILPIVITLIVIGVLLWLVNNYIPMDRRIKMILNILVLVVVVIWLLRVLGAWAYLSNVTV